MCSPGYRSPRQWTSTRCCRTSGVPADKLRTFSIARGLPSRVLCGETHRMPKPWYVDGRLPDRKEHRRTLTTIECREMLPNLWAAPSLPADYSHLGVSHLPGAARRTDTEEAS